MSVRNYIYSMTPHVILLKIFIKNLKFIKTPPHVSQLLMTRLL